MDVRCPICHQSDKIETLMPLFCKGANIEGWHCVNCCHFWRTEPWKTSDVEKFFAQASYTDIKNAERLDSTKKKLFENCLRWSENLAKGSSAGLDVEPGQGEDRAGEIG